MLDLPRLILGGNIFGHFADAAQTRAVLDAADDLGCRAVDTADAYSDGRSEEFIGRALRGRRERFAVMTKAGLETGESASGKFRPDYLRQALDASLQRLGVDRVDIYQLHAYDDKTPLEEQIGTLSAFIQDGKIGAYGVSNYTAENLEQAVEVARQNHWPLPATAQAWWNVLDAKAGEAIATLCARERIALLPYGALARGLLTGKYRPGAPIPRGTRAMASDTLRRELTPDRLAAVERLKPEAERRGLSLAQYAVQWLLEQPAVASVIVGVRTPEQLREFSKIL